MIKSKVMKEAMRVVWENESLHNKFEDLWEYPYTDRERERIFARLEKTVKDLKELLK